MLSLQEHANRRGFGCGRLLLAWLVLLGAGCASHEAVYDLPAPPGPAQAPPTARVSQLPDIAFTIQVGAFSTVWRAARYAEALEGNGLDAYYFIDQDGLYKVRFERFESKAAARARARGLKARGLIEEFYIVQPRAAKPAVDVQAALRADLVQTARRFIGTPYRWGGASTRQGFDCSGLTMTVYRLNGLQLPRSAWAQYLAGAPQSRRRLQQGDLVFFATGRCRRVSHVGVYIGRDRFIHAPGRGKSIRTATLNSSYFKKHYVGARTYL